MRYKYNGSFTFDKFDGTLKLCYILNFHLLPRERERVPLNQIDIILDIKRDEFFIVGKMVSFSFLWFVAITATVTRIISCCKWNPISCVDVCLSSVYLSTKHNFNNNNNFISILFDVVMCAFLSFFFDSVRFFVCATQFPMISRSPK